MITREIVALNSVSDRSVRSYSWMCGSMSAYASTTFRCSRLSRSAINASNCWIQKTDRCLFRSGSRSPFALFVLRNVGSRFHGSSCRTKLQGMKWSILRGPLSQNASRLNSVPVYTSRSERRSRASFHQCRASVRLRWSGGCIFRGMAGTLGLRR